MAIRWRNLATRTRLSAAAVLLLLLVGRSSTTAGEGRVAFLAPEPTADRFGPETRAAFDLAKQLASASLLLPTDDGAFVDEQGRPAPLDRYEVIWRHQGDTSLQTTAGRQQQAIEALRAWVSDGGGLFLSGASLALVHPLGVEKAQPRLCEGGRDNLPAELVPVAMDHPIFQGLTLRGPMLDESVGGNVRELTATITDAGYPAFADFQGARGPRGGRLLARGGAEENPLVEYELGNGRVIAMGWRWPHYAHSQNAHRANLERLTKNILSYLRDGQSWRPAATAAAPAPAPDPGVLVGQWRAVELAVRDLMAAFPQRYAKGPDYLQRLRALKERHDQLATKSLSQEGRTGLPVLRGGLAMESSSSQPADDVRLELARIVERFQRLRREALLDNPLLDFDRLLLVQRGAAKLGLPNNYHGNSDLPPTGYDNRLAILSPVRPEGELTTLYRPGGGEFVGDVDLHFNADRLLFSMPYAQQRWGVFELDVEGGEPRKLPLIDEPDVDNYDACYLPDGRLVFCSTAPFVGVPCVYGKSHVTNLYLLERDRSIRQLTVDQDHDWCPVATNCGRVMYLRWEYADLPHANSRILFHMNPDGTEQMEYYGSNSYFVNSFFFARPIPGHPTKVVGIATGHHGVARAGRMLILDPAAGRREASGVVQEVPGWGRKVEAVIRDELVADVWPQFLHPFPLSEKYFLAAVKLHPQSLWGIYLVDVFDNMVLLKELDGYALLEPVPLRATPTPPAIADKVQRQRRDAVVYLNDVYFGDGLKGIPRGTVKQLRLFTYHYSYRGMGGLLGSVGMDGPWDVKRVLGTVPVAPDGSALFRVPANTPIAVQPLDAGGQALQLMRSWFTAMPGEVLSCVGCHEQQNRGVLNRPTAAARRAASEIKPWYGPTRGFSFPREVQPVLDRHCVSCHDGRPRPGGVALCDLRGDRIIEDWSSGISGHVQPSVGGRFSTSYVELHRFVRRPGIESDLRMLTPMEFHASTTELFQLLAKGHHGVALDREARDRLATWIDLNAPHHGTWSEVAGEAPVKPMAQRRREMSRRYAGVDEDPEAIPPAPQRRVEPAEPVATTTQAAAAPSCAGWPFDAAEARRRQMQAGPQWRRTVALDRNLTLELVLIPPGEFVMGDAAGQPDEGPASRVAVAQPFWMSRCEITNEQFAAFDPSHDSRVEPMHGYQFGIHGYPANQPRQPAVRVSWEQAVAFCNWLSERSGCQVSLPSEAQWEYACRAGSASPMWYGGLEADFSQFANLGDAKLSEFALDTYIRVRLVSNPSRYDDWVPKEDRFNDQAFLSAPVGGYRPNPWGLCDMHGNVWEWTGTAYGPYPYQEDDGRNDLAAAGKKAVRGGSWYDRPKRCRSASRLAYEPYQRVFNVGFRVVLAPGKRTRTPERTSHEATETAEEERCGRSQ